MKKFILDACSIAIVFFQSLPIQVNISFRYSFVKVPRPGGSELTFWVFESSCHLYYQSDHSKVEAIPLSALPKDATSELAGLSPHQPFYMLNVKHRAMNTNFLNGHLTLISYI